MKNNKVVCFGAGEMAEVYWDFLCYLGIEIVCWIDNDRSKQGKSIFDKPIKAISELINCEYKILITSVYFEEIFHQLDSLGFGNKVITLDELIDENVLVNNERVLNKEYTLFFDAHDGYPNWAGTEIWALNLCERSILFKNKCLIVTEGMENELRNKEIDIYEAPKRGGCAEIIELLQRQLPIVVIQSFGKYVLFAALYLKKKYPEMVKIIAVMHNDIDANIKRQSMYENYLDGVVGVSENIKYRASRIFKKCQIETFTQAIVIPPNIERKYTENGILRIGYAARLVKKQKRADLLIDFISEMEKKNVPYLLKIAGEGELYSELECFIQRQGLNNKIKMLGQIPIDLMGHFWENVDIYINLSEYEGCSLAMLEAMSYKCVPIVTNVSGVNEIISEKNGVICEVGDVKSIVEKVVQLADPVKLKEFGENAYSSVAENCNINQYAYKWANYINERIY